MSCHVFFLFSGSDQLTSTWLFWVYFFYFIFSKRNDIYEISSVQCVDKGFYQRFLKKLSKNLIFSIFAVLQRSVLFSWVLIKNKEAGIDRNWHLLSKMVEWLCMQHEYIQYILLFRKKSTMINILNDWLIDFRRTYDCHIGWDQCQWRSYGKNRNSIFAWIFAYASMSQH